MEQRNFFIFAIIILLIFVTGCTASKEPGPLTRTEFLMDTVITLKIYDLKDEKIMDRAIERLIEIEDRMSPSIETSDVSLINKSAGRQAVVVHDDVYYVVGQAKYFAEISGGAYEPTIGPLVDLWAISSGDRGERDSLPGEREIREAMALVDYNDLELMGANKVFLKRKGMKLDLGGIAKGYAADEVKRIFLESGVKSAIIDLGGNVYAVGEKENGENWRIGIQDPMAETGSYLGILKVIDKSIVTSGGYERFFMHRGRRYHHIIDAKTGYPAESGLESVTIISDKSIEGDTLSTALFVLGLDKGCELVGQLRDIETILVNDSGDVFVDERIIDDFILSNKNLKLIKNPN